MIARVQYFAPAVLIGFLLIYAGGWLNAFGQFINQVLFAWAAFCMLRNEQHLTPVQALAQRMPAHGVVWLCFGLGAAIFVGGPTIYALKGWNWAAASGIVLLALIFLMLATRTWLALYLCFFDPAVANINKGLSGAGPVAALSGRRSLSLSAGPASHTLEAYFPAVGSMVLCVWPFALEAFSTNMGLSTQIYWTLNISALLLVSPLIHLGLAYSCSQHILTGDEVETKARSRLDFDMYLQSHDEEQPIKAENNTRPAEAVETQLAQDVCNAAASGDLNQLKTRLQHHSPDSEFDGQTPLIAAIHGASAGRMGVIDWLLDQGADLDAGDKDANTALHHAILQQDLTTVEALMSAGADAGVLNNEALSPLALSASIGAWPCLHRLVDMGADIQTNQGQPVLLAAAMPGSDDPVGVEYLIQQNVDPNCLGKLNRTALMGASLKGYAQIAETLLKEGADINAQDQFGNTALMEATRSGANAVLERFVFWNPDTEKRDKPGRTAVLVAVSSRRADADTIRLLLAMGADKNVRNRDDRQAGELAAAAGRWWIAKALGLETSSIPNSFSSETGEVAVKDADGPKVIELAQFETADDVAWVERQMQSKSRTQLHSAQGVESIQEESAAVEEAGEAQALKPIPDSPPPLDETEQASEANSIAEKELLLEEMTSSIEQELTEEDTNQQLRKSEDVYPELVSEEDLELTPLDKNSILTTVEALSEVSNQETTEEDPKEVDEGQPAAVGNQDFGYRALVEAARTGDTEQMQMILDSEADLPEWWLSSAFLNSVAEGHIVVPSWLLENGLSANAVSESGQTLLTCVIQQAPPNPDILEILIKHGARVDADPEILHWLSGMADAQHEVEPAKLESEMENRLQKIILEILNRGGAELAQNTDVQGKTALHWAVRYRSSAFSEILLSEGAKVDAQDEHGVSSLLQAARSGDMSQVRTLCRSGADAHLADETGISPMSYALKAEDQTLSKILMMAASKQVIKTPLPASAQNQHSAADLIDASSQGKLGAVKRILAQKPDINVRDSQGCTALLRAAGAGHPTVVTSLAAAGANLNVAANNGMTPLGAAVMGGHREIVRLLIDRGVDVNQPQQYGLTVLMLSAARWQLDMLEVLLKSGADAKATDDSESTALMAAAQNALLSNDMQTGRMVFDKLIDAGTDLDAVNDEGQNALMLLLGVRARSVNRASVSVVLELAKLLIKRGANLDAQDYTGWSALHAAASHGFSDPAKLLLESGANRRLRDINGLSACDLAMDNAHDDLVDLFV